MDGSFTRQLIEEQNAKADMLKKRYMYIENTLSDAEALYDKQCEIAGELEAADTVILKLKRNIKEQYEETDNVRMKLRVLLAELAEELGYEES